VPLNPCAVPQLYRAKVPIPGAGFQEACMGIFSAIRDAIFGHPAAKPQPQTPQPSPRQAMPQMGQPAQPQRQPVDVEAVLTQIAASKGNPNLDWRHSIVDLMKLLDLDSSLHNREELAGELGYTGAKDGSAEMNIWLHKRVMAELEKSGGKVPAALKD
jgi:hypothetical protein